MNEDYDDERSRDILDDSEDDTIEDDEIPEDDSDEDNDDDDKKNAVWTYFAEKAAERLGIDLSTSSFILREPYLSEFVHEIDKIVSVHLAAAQHMENDDNIFGKIKNKMEKYEDDGFTKAEAWETNWSDRRFLVQEVLKKLNLFEESDEEDDEE